MSTTPVCYSRRTEFLDLKLSAIHITQHAIRYTSRQLFFFHIWVTEAPLRQERFLYGTRRDPSLQVEPAARLVVCSRRPRAAKRLLANYRTRGLFLTYKRKVHPLGKLLPNMGFVGKICGYGQGRNQANCSILRGS